MAPRNKKVHEYMKTYNSFSGTDMVATMYLPGVEGVEGAIVLGSLQTISYSIHMDRSPIRAISNINAKTYVMGQRTIAGSLVFAVFDRHFAYEAMRKLKGNNANFYFLADELPPFDITISFANEYGHRAKLAIYGVRLIDEGQVMSINDILTENTYQFVATDIDLLSDNDSSADGELIYDGLKPSQSITKPVDITWNKPSSTDIDELTSEYDYALRTYVIKEPEDSTKLGLVEISFEGEIPKSGKIIVYRYIENGSTAEWAYNLTISCTESTPYPVQTALPVGDYKIQYFDMNEKPRSKQVEFSITKKEVVFTVQPPTINTCLLDMITLNVAAGTENILYRRKGINTWITLPVSNNKKTVTATNLSSGTTYIFKAEAKGVESTEVEGTTLEYIENTLAEFEAYLTFNKDLMTEHGVSFMKIKEVAKKAHDIYIDTLKKYKLKLPIADAVMKALKEFSSTAATFSLMRTETITERDVNLIALEAARFENRFAEIQNKNIDCVQIIDAIRGILLLPLDTRQLIIEPIDGPKRIIALSKTRKTEKGYVYQTMLDAGIYSVYTINNVGVYTSKITLTVLTDRVKSELLNRQDAIEKDKAYMFNKARDEMIIYNGQVKDNDMLYTYWSNIQNLTQSDAVQPDIIEIKGDTVTIQPVSYVNVLPLELYLCIEEIDKAQDRNTIRKIKVSRENKYIAKLTTEKDCIIKGRRYAVWYQEVDSLKRYRPTCFIFEEDYDEDEISAACAKKDKDILLRNLKIIATRTGTTHLLEYLEEIISSVFEDATQNLEKSINNIIETVYNENMLTKKHLCESICLIFAARNTILSRYNNEDISRFIVKDNSLAKAADITQVAYLKRFIVNKEGVTYLAPEKIVPGQYFELNFYKEKEEVIGFYLIESDKEKVGLPTIMDASEHMFYGRRVLNDNK